MSRPLTEFELRRRVYCEARGFFDSPDDDDDRRGESLSALEHAIEQYRQHRQDQARRPR